MANDSNSSDVRIKKVSPYPIDVDLGGSSGKILKLAATGFLVETVLPLKVNTVYTSLFNLPVVNWQISFSGVVVKTYDRFRGQLGESSSNLKLAEINFKSISPDGLEKINQFLRKIGQAN